MEISYFILSDQAHLVQFFAVQTQAGGPQLHVRQRTASGPPRQLGNDYP